MRTGITDYYIKKYGLEAGARRMAEHGYSCLDYQLTNTDGELYALRDEDFLIRLTEIRKMLNGAGITVEQIHGPWREPCDATEEDRAERFEKMTKAIVMARYLGAKYMAIHPLMPFGITGENPEQLYAINKKFFVALASVAGKLGVTVCLENMPFRDFPLSRVEDIVDFIKDIDSPHLKMCFDAGHANVFEGRIGDMVRCAGELIKTVHVHDNFGERDEHNVPYEGTVDWADFAEGLFDIGFDGVLNLECAPVSPKFIENGIDADETVALEKELAKIARLIAG